MISRSIKNMNLIKSLLAASCLCLALFVMPRHSLALTASPVRIELAGDPGQTIGSSFELYNDEKKTNKYVMEVVNFEARDESGMPRLLKDKRGGLVEWTAFSVQQVQLDAGERMEVEFNINIPSNAEPGGYFAAVLAKLDNTEQLRPGEVALENTVGTLVLLRVNGQLQEGGDLLEFKTMGGSYFSSLPIEFSYRFQNTSNTWAKPVGDVVINDIFGRTRKVISANPDGNNILSKSIRKFSAVWWDSSGEKVQKERGTESQFIQPPPTGFWPMVKYEWKNFVFGRFVASITLSYGEGFSGKVSKDIAFYVIPWHLLTVIVAGVLLQALIFYRNRVSIFIKRRTSRNRL